MSVLSVNSSTLNGLIEIFLCALNLIICNKEQRGRKKIHVLSAVFHVYSIYSMSKGDKGEFIW